MSEFQAYLQLGFAHITDPNGYDHILFVVALCAIFDVLAWRKVLLLVTAFTMGHSVTLALSVFKIVNIRGDVVELLIPITILITAWANFFTTPTGDSKSPRTRYLMAVFFGLIHGLGFSNYLRSLLGDAEGIIAPLFAFNVGLELGQLLIVTTILLLASVFTNVLKIQKITWNHLVSGMVAGMALSLILQNELFGRIDFF